LAKLPIQFGFAYLLSGYVSVDYASFGYA